LNFISYFVKICCATFTSDEKAQEIDEFFKKHPTPAANRAIQQSIETIKTNTAWLKRDGKDIEEFLKNL
jgi:puromycin-sensitive aminopeptidase